MFVFQGGPMATTRSKKKENEFQSSSPKTEPASGTLSSKRAELLVKAVNAVKLIETDLDMLKNPQNYCGFGDSPTEFAVKAWNLYQQQHPNPKDIEDPTKDPKLIKLTGKKAMTLHEMEVLIRKYDPQAGASITKSG